MKLQKVLDPVAQCLRLELARVYAMPEFGDPAEHQAFALNGFSNSEALGSQGMSTPGFRKSAQKGLLACLEIKQARFDSPGSQDCEAFGQRRKCDTSCVHAHRDLFVAGF